MTAPDAVAVHGAQQREIAAPKYDTRHTGSRRWRSEAREAGACVVELLGISGLLFVVCWLLAFPPHLGVGGGALVPAPIQQSKRAWF
jgi:hypothetical protein